MIIEKITECTIVQEFDTEEKRFVRQHCIAGNECILSANRELENGELSEDSNLTEEETQMMNKEYLPYDMVQPEEI